MSQIEGIYTTKQAAVYLNLAVVTVKYHITKGNLKGKIIGHTRVFEQSELDEFNRSRRKPGRPKTKKD